MVVFCSLFQSNTLNQLARTAHNSQIADICFEDRGLAQLPDPGGTPFLKTSKGMVSGAEPFEIGHRFWPFWSEIQHTLCTLVCF